jgi:Tfp pilus assembly protein PilN
MSIMQSQQTFSEVGAQVRMPRVNLLPPEIMEGRRLRTRKAVLAGSLVVVLAGIGVGYVVEVNAKATAQDQLTQAQAERGRLMAEQSKYADVPRTIAAIDAAETARANAMATDVEWYRTLTNFALTLPSNVWFTTVELQTAGGQQGAAPVAVGPGTAGSLSVEGRALDHPDVAAWLDVLGSQPAVEGAYFSNSEKKKIDDKTVVEFASSAVVTDEALSHRYDRKQG